MRKIVSIKGKSIGQYGEYLIKNNHGIFFRVHRATTEVAVVDPSKSQLTANAAINTHSQDHYQVLDVSPSASFEEIKAAYKKLVLQYHPDKNKSTEVAAKFLEITAAFEVLGDPQERLRFDLQKQQPWSVHSGTKAICFSKGDSATVAGEDKQLLIASSFLLLLLLLFNNPSLLGVSEREIRDHVNSREYFDGAFSPMHLPSIMLMYSSLASTLASTQTDVFFKCSALNEIINRVTSFPCMTSEWLYELTQECPASFPNPYAPQTDFFVSSSQRVTQNINRGLGEDGFRLMQKLLTAGFKIEEIRFYDNSEITSDGPFSGILVPKSSIADLSSFQQSLKGISNCGRTFPVVVEGEWLKINCVAISAPEVTNHI